MLKKILIGLLILALLASGVAYYGYKKIEKQFDAAMMAEVQRRKEAAEKAIQEQLEAQKNTINEESTSSESEIKDEVTDIDAQIDEVVESTTEVDDNTEEVEETTDEVTESTTTEDTNNGDVVDKTSTSSTTESTSTTTESASTTTETVDSTTEDIKEEVVDNSSNEETTEEVVDNTTEEVTEPEEEYTEEDFERDKKKAMDLAMSRLSASQISRLIDLSAGGFTPEEKTEAKEMFYSNFTVAEQEWILGIYDKYYGLISEG